MTDQDIIRAVAELDGQLVPHTPTEAERNSGSYYQWEPNYLSSRDVIIGVIEKTNCHLRNDFIAHLWKIAGNEPSVIFWTEYNLRGFYAVIVATPRQLCEALLRATGKWKE